MKPILSENAINRMFTDIERQTAIAMLGGYADAEAIAHACVLSRVLHLIIEKDTTYGGAWRIGGLGASVLKIRTRVHRLWNVTWRPLTEDGQSVDLLVAMETLIDTLAYATFAYEQALAGEEWANNE